MHTSIELKFGTHIGLAKANNIIRTKFDACRTKNLVVIAIIAVNKDRSVDRPTG